MSKINSDALKESITAVLKGAQDKKRKFGETIKLPNIPRPRMSCCILGDAKHVEQAKAAGIPCMDVEALKALNKDKKKVKKLACKYNFFLASPTVLKQIPRLLG